MLSSDSSFFQVLKDGSCVLKLYVQPRASSNAWAGIQGDALKLRLTTPPVDGKANKAVIAFVAKALGLAKQCVSIKTGQQSRSKTLLIQGADEEFLRQRIQIVLNSAGK